MIPWVFWFCSCATVAIMAVANSAGWDLRVYTQAMEWVRGGHDPYAQGVAVQQAFYDQHGLHAHGPRPMTYVYSPITLPALRLAGMIAPWLRNGLYWLAYAAAVLGQIWVVMQLPEKRERQTFLFLAPAAAFFPGLLQHDVIFSGNLVYILYGLIFGAAYRGWKRGKWGWFYAAVLITGCCKAPLLTLLAIPVFSARKQWLKAAVNGAVGISICAGQAWFWPEKFNSYLQAVELQFRYNRDFGIAPAGMLGRALLDAGMPYWKASTALYLLIAASVLATLIYFSRRFFAGEYSLERWVPVMLVGVVLLNPRIKEYDVAMLTLPMALLGWRALETAIGSKTGAIIAGAALFLAANVIAFIGIGDNWKYTEMVLLLALFAGGCWQLTRQRREDYLPSLQR